MSWIDVSCRGTVTCLKENGCRSGASLCMGLCDPGTRPTAAALGFECVAGGASLDLEKENPKNTMECFT